MGMSDNVTLVKILESQNEPTFFMIILAGIILLIGILIATVRTSENNTVFKIGELFAILKDKKIRRFLGVAIILFAIMLLFVESSSLREPLVALVAVLATGISIIGLYESNKIKIDVIERDRKERQREHLSELIDWTVQTLKHITIPASFSKDPQEIAKNLIECRNELMVQHAKSIVVFAQTQDITSSADSDVAVIKDTVSTVSSSMAEFIHSLLAIYNTKSEPEVIVDIVNKLEGLVKKLRELLDMLAHLKL